MSAKPTKKQKEVIGNLCHFRLFFDGERMVWVDNIHFSDADIDGPNFRTIRCLERDGVVDFVDVPPAVSDCFFSEVVLK